MPFKKYTMKGNGYCRGCSEDLPMGKNVISAYTPAGSGLQIFLCDACTEVIAAFALEKYDSIEDFGEKLVMKKFSE